jgi:hypothetical protein
VSFFGSSDVPLDLAILLDTSASMTNRLETAQKAAMGLLSLVPLRAESVEGRAIIQTCSPYWRWCSPQLG